MDVYFYQFTKKPNSTMRPPESGFGLDMQGYNCVLKEKTSVLEPVILLNTKIQGDNGETININPIRWNYCFIPDFRRYYFITNIVSAFNLWEIYLRVDVLASYADEILEEETYIVRSEHFRDEFLSDAMFPATANVHQAITPIETTGGDMVYNPASGTYVIGVINPQSTITACAYYAMTYAQFGALKQALFSVSNFRNSNDIEITDDLLKVLFNPFQYISSVMYLPFDISKISTMPDTLIEFGWWGGATGVSAYGRLINPPVRRIYIGDFTITRHPEAGDNDAYFELEEQNSCGVEPFSGLGQYLNYAPYSRYYLRFEPFGFFELDNDALGAALSSTEVNANGGLLTISLYLRLDTITGLASLYYQLSPTDLNNWYRITPTQGVIGVQMQIGQITSDIAGGALTALQGIAQGSSQFNLFKPVSSAFAGAVTAAAGIYDGLQTAAPKLQTSGTQGNLATYGDSLYMLSIHQDVTPHAPSEVGYPLMRIMKIKDCEHGFVKTLFTDLQIPRATETERDEIVKILNSGFHIEEWSE